MRNCVTSPTPHPTNRSKKSYCAGIGGENIPDEYDAVAFVSEKVEKLFLDLFDGPEKKILLNRDDRAFFDKMKVAD